MLCYGITHQCCHVPALFVTVFTTGPTCGPLLTCAGPVCFTVVPLTDGANFQEFSVETAEPPAPPLLPSSLRPVLLLLRNRKRHPGLAWSPGVGTHRLLLLLPSPSTTGPDPGEIAEIVTICYKNMLSTLTAHNVRL